MSDSLKQAVEGLEAAWRRLREVLDGPDVAAALVERQAVRPMSTAPRDGTGINIHFKDGSVLKCRRLGGNSHTPVSNVSSALWTCNGGLYHEGDALGWSPVKPEANQWPSPMSTAPRDGTWVYLRLRSGHIPKCKWDVAVNHWTDDHRRGHAEQEAIGWSPVAPETNQWPNPMSTAPRDGTPITLHHVWGDRIQALYHVGYRGWVDRQNNLLREEGVFIGWSPVK